MRRYALRDDQWERIKDFLPGREGHVGGTAADNRLFVEAVLFRYRAGVPWRDLPERFGDWKIVYQRIANLFFAMHQHPDHDSDDAQRPHDGEGDKATLEKIHPDTPCSQGRHVSNVNYGSGFRVS